MSPRLVAHLFTTTIAVLASGSSGGAAAKFEINKVRLDMALEEVRQVLGQPFECGPPHFVIRPRDTDGDMDCERPPKPEHHSPGDMYLVYPVRISYRFRHRKLGSVVMFGLPAASYDAVEAELRQRFGVPSVDSIGVDWQSDGQSLGLQRKADSEGHSALILSAAWYAHEWKQTLDQRGN